MHNMRFWDFGGIRVWLFRRFLRCELNILSSVKSKIKNISRHSRNTLPLSLNLHLTAPPKRQVMDPLSALGDFTIRGELDKIVRFNDDFRFGSDYTFLCSTSTAYLSKQGNLYTSSKMVANWIIISDDKFNFVALKSGICQFHPLALRGGPFFDIISVQLGPWADVLFRSNLYWIKRSVWSLDPFWIYHIKPLVFGHQSTEIDISEEKWW